MGKSRGKSKMILFLEFANCIYNITPLLFDYLD